jgi:hypothetical protein
MLDSMGLSHVKLNTLGEDLIKGFQNTGEILKSKATDIKDGLVSRFTEAKNTIIDRWEDIKYKFQSFGNTIGSAFKEGLLSAIKWALNGIQNRINSFIRDINWVVEWIRKIPGANWISTIPEIKIPGLSQGAVLKGGSPMLAFLNDQPKGQVNIETPLNTMVEAFNSALKQNGSNAGSNITIEATGDIGQLVSFLNFKLKQENLRIGNNFVSGDAWI